MGENVVTTTLLTLQEQQQQQKQEQILSNNTKREKHRIRQHQSISSDRVMNTFTSREREKEGDRCCFAISRIFTSLI